MSKKTVATIFLFSFLILSWLNCFLVHANPDTFGYTTVGSILDGYPWLGLGSQFTLSVKANVTKLTAWLTADSASSTITCAIYRVSDKKLMGVTNPNDVTWHHFDWLDFPFGTPLILERGDYVLTMGFGGVPIYGRNEPTGGIDWSCNDIPFPDPMVGSITGTKKWSIYATYTSLECPLSINALNVANDSSLSVPMKISDAEYYTPISVSLQVGIYIVQPEDYGFNTTHYWRFVNWTDNADRTRTINFTGPASYTAYYQLSKIQSWGGYFNFFLGLAGLGMMASSWFVLKWQWDEKNYGVAILTWMMLLFVGFALCTILFGG